MVPSGNGPSDGASITGVLTPFQGQDAAGGSYAHHFSHKLFIRTVKGQPGSQGKKKRPHLSMKRLSKNVQSSLTPVAIKNTCNVGAVLETECYCLRHIVTPHYEKQVNKDAVQLNQEELKVITRLFTKYI